MRLPHRLQGQKVKSKGHGAGAYCGGHLAAQLVVNCDAFCHHFSKVLCRHVYQYTVNTRFTCRGICDGYWPCRTWGVSRGLVDVRRPSTERRSWRSSCDRPPGSGEGSRVRRCSHAAVPSAPAPHTSPPAGALVTPPFNVKITPVFNQIYLLTRKCQTGHPGRKPCSDRCP